LYDFHAECFLIFLLPLFTSVPSFFCLHFVSLTFSFFLCLSFFHPSTLFLFVSLIHSFVSIFLLTFVGSFVSVPSATAPRFSGLSIDIFLHCLRQQTDRSSIVWKYEHTFMGPLETFVYFMVHASGLEAYNLVVK